MGIANKWGCVGCSHVIWTSYHFHCQVRETGIIEVQPLSEVVKGAVEPIGQSKVVIGTPTGIVTLRLANGTRLEATKEYCPRCKDTRLVQAFYHHRQIESVGYRWRIGLPNVCDRCGTELTLFLESTETCPKCGTGVLALIDQWYS